MRKVLLLASVGLGLFAVACASGEDGAPGPAAAVDCGVTPYATGCEKKATGTPDSKAGTTQVVDGDTTVTTTPKASAQELCAAKTCEDYKGACGDHDDGCGKTFNCGTCAPAAPDCKKQTCDDLAVTCGTHDDGCGGTVSCGVCATDCATDAKEPNDSKEAAVKLGAAADTEDKTFAIKNLDSADGDEDWFTIDVSDKGFGSNPTITATSTDENLEVAIYHQCKSLPNYSYCYGGLHGTDKQDNTEVGFGCVNAGSVTLKTDCAGIDESGTTYVRVRKTATDLSCHAYDLSVQVF